MTLVKICGITNLQDANHAVKCGADALGFNFYPRSKRFITPQEVRDIFWSMNGFHSELSLVGVFVNSSYDDAASIGFAAGLDTIQFHGDETPEFVADFESEYKKIFRVVKAIRVGEEFSLDELERYKVGHILLDAHSATEFGGTGKKINWDMAKQIRRRVPKLFLAGGLSPENVARAVKQVRPYAVDACSLLETAPGRKDHTKVAAFIKAAKEAI